MLVVSAAATTPADRADRRRIAALCQRLRMQGAELHLLHYPAEPEPQEPVPIGAMRHMAATWDSYLIAPVTRPVFTPPEGTEHTIDAWWDPAIGQMVTWLTQMYAFDAILVGQLWLSHALTLVPRGVLRILDAHDRVWVRPDGPRDGGTSPPFSPNDEQERIGLARADVVWATGPLEARWLAGKCERPVRVVPHAEPPGPPLPASAPPDILRLGLRYPGGTTARAALRSFLETAETYVRRTLLPCELVLWGALSELAGQSLPPFVRCMPPDTTAGGFLTAVDVVLGVADLTTDLAGGIADALACGKPVIAETPAFAGLVTTHRLHVLSSSWPVLRACGELAATPALFDDLQQASLEAQARASRSADLAIAATAPATPALPPGIVFVLAADQAFAGSLVMDHLHEAAVFARHQCPVAFFLLGTATPEPAALLRLRALGPVLCAPETAPGLGVHPAAARVTTLDALLDGATALWFVCVPRDLPRRLRPATTTVILPLAVLAGSAEDAQLLAFTRRLKPLAVRLIATDVHPSALLAAVSACRSETILLPVFWRGYDSALLERARDAKRRSVVLFAPDADDPMLALARKVISAATTRPVEVVVCGRDSANGGLTAWLKTIRHSDGFPWLAVEVGCLGAAAPLMELFDRAGIARLGLFQPDAPLPPAGGRTLGRAGGIMESAALLAEVLLDETRVDELAALGPRRFPATENGGWSLMWDVILTLVQPPAQSGDRPGRISHPDRTLHAEVMLQVQDRGTFRYAMRNWIGLAGEKRAIEAFAVRPLETLLPSDVEYRAVGPEGRETPWVSDARLCGTRDQGLPLTGFAIRLLPHLRDRFEVVYEGSFMDGDVSGPNRNGEPCLPAIVDTPLQGMRIWLRERGYA